MEVDSFPALPHNKICYPMSFITQQHKLFFQTLSSTICHPGDVLMVYESLWAGNWCLWQLWWLWSLTVVCLLQRSHTVF